MKQRLPAILVFLYLLSCIVLGGSAQNPWPNLGLQLVGIAVIAWAAVAANRHSSNSALYALILGALAVVLLQLVPLPASVWTRLPGRDAIEQGLHLLGYETRAFSISEMPGRSVLTLFAAIPAIAAFIVVDRLAISPGYVAAAIVGGMIAAIFVGAIQVAGGPNSSAYFYEIHSLGAIGFFANGNHMGTLLLVGMPMAAALVASAKSARGFSGLARIAVGAAVFVVIAVGIALNGSRAALGLSVPVLIASAAIFPAAVRWRAAALGASAIALVVGVAAIATVSMSASEVSPSPASPAYRQQVWATTTRAVAANFPWGTGLGTFERVYDRYENPDDITPSYVNHAHNEYLEIALELGALGIALMVLFMGWWALAGWKIWTSAYGTPFGRAATIAAAAILAHSAVDFPLRTGAISAVFAACLALMAIDLRHSAGAAVVQSGRKRHVKLG